MRSTHLFNYDWLYIAQEADKTTPDSDFASVIIPHSNTDLPWHNFDDKEYQFVSTYRKHFTLPEKLDGRRLYLDFEGVMTAATVMINDHTFDEHKGGFVPFSYDITDYINPDGDNMITVRVDSTERADIPPHGGQVDYLVFGGIYRDVYLRYERAIHITNVQIKTFNVLTDKPRVEIDVYVNNTTTNPYWCKVVAFINLLGLEEHYAGDIYEEQMFPPNSKQTVTIQINPEFKPDVWTLSDPNLYECNVGLIPHGDSRVIMQKFKFGFREAQFREDGFYLNGEKVFLRGLNRHQMYPFIGMAAPARLQARDADIIKDMGCNIVRTSHYPQSKYFLDRCDEIGLLVFEEIPGWQHIGDDDWQDISLRDVRVMIERDWNHPSIVVWGVRINESWDNNAFYTKTNALARQLDPTRQTTGVRFFPTSEFLEDVYGFNDFTNGILEPMESPWLVTEYNGHMYPTKTFDNEERQQEHVRRHAHVQAQAMSTGGVSGAIGWCAFDYNTHLDFGSGDRVCYHGVFDMWRQPKWAAHVYGSQQSRDEKLVMEIATFWTMGDRAGGGNDPFYVLTNCDAVDVYVGGQHHGRFTPDSEQFPSLPHPPITVPGLDLHWGGKFEGLRIVGYVNDEVAIGKQIEADSLPRQLVFYAEDDTLHADGMDMTRLVFKITDKFGNRLPYAIQPVHFELLADSAPADLIGENPFALVGGQAALFLRAGRTAGTVGVRATTPRLAPVEIEITIK